MMKRCPSTMPKLATLLCEMLTFDSVLWYCCMCNDNCQAGWFCCSCRAICGTQQIDYDGLFSRVDWHQMFAPALVKCNSFFKIYRKV